MLRTCFGSGRSRHTRCSFVTGVYTGAFPLSDSNLLSPADIEDRIQSIYRQRAAEIDKGPRRPRSGESRPGWQDAHTDRLTKLDRSEESRVGKECDSTCGSGWSP